MGGEDLHTLRVVAVEHHECGLRNGCGVSVWKGWMDVVSGLVGGVFGASEKR